MTLPLYKTWHDYVCTFSSFAHFVFQMLWWVLSYHVNLSKHATQKSFAFLHNLTHPKIYGAYQNLCNYLNWQISDYMWQCRRQTYKMRRKPWTLSIVLSQRVCYYYNTVKCYFTTFKNCPIMWENRHMQTCAKLPFPHFSVCRCMRGRYLLNIFSYSYFLF